MKYQTLSLSLALFATMTRISTPVNEAISKALKQGTTTINTRIYYFNRSFDKLDVKGIMKYESGKTGSFKVGLGYFG